MEIRLSTEELDLTELVLSHLKTAGYPIPDDATVVIEEGEAIVTYGLSANAPSKPQAPKKAAQSRAKKSDKPAPPPAETVTTQAGSFVEGDTVEQSPEQVDDAFPIASNPEVAPTPVAAATSIFAGTAIAQPQAEEQPSQTPPSIFG